MNNIVYLSRDPSLVALTNFEVLDLLNSRNASKDTTRVLAQVARSEYKVYDYLMETAASTRTLKSVTTFSDQCKDFKLAKSEIPNIINIRPSVDAKALLKPIIEEPKKRGIHMEGILEFLQDLLPPLPTTHIENDQDETKNGEES
ncbi:hypothetical protein Bca52824_009710 [Brassica carinata]|uniref:DNA-directed RNA polymerase III subunit RPC9 n=1 Tax=Brassica carinata TaxID=52824 RepID=A0A8X8BAJ0_BRACI|nr:hypothetical protein Bca52824_009710 [Brassica carinata]